VEIAKITATDLRNNHGPILDKIERGEPVEVTRYHRTAAVLVPADYFEKAVAAIGEPVPVLGRK
jgi:prevent-host-death family protein